MACWQCGAEALDVVCACGALQPPAPDADSFSRLGLPRRFELDLEDLLARHRTEQRKVHPDRYVSRPPRERELSLQHSTALNDAARTLRDPLRRVEYLLLLRGLAVQGDSDGRLPLDPQFLMEIIELREALAELDAPDALVERGRILREVAARYEALLRELGHQLDAEPDGPTRFFEWGQMAGQLRYLRRVLDEIQGDA